MRSKNDPNLYIKEDEDKNVALISVYVDDLIIAGNACKLIEKLKNQLSHVFEMKDLGELYYCLGLEVWREPGNTLITQSKYTREILKRFNIIECKATSTPLEQNVKLCSDDGTKEVNGTMYHQLVGSLNYLTTSRPDIAYSVSILSQFMAKPCESHWKAAKKVLRYLKGTLNFGIMYTDEFDVELAGPISWSSKKQLIVSLSSTEAEYKALCSATCEAIWLRRILEDVGETQQAPTVTRCDNKSTIKLANNPIYHARTKHIETQHHFLRETLQSKEIDLSYCNTSENVADIFTKPLGKAKFEICRNKLYIVENPNYVVSQAET
eukprot:PITA_09302